MKFKYFNPQLTQKGILAIFEYLVRIHPIIYLLARELVKFTSIFENDFLGVKQIKFKKLRLGTNNINVIDVGASDGISANAIKRLIKNTGKIYCFEPNPRYVKMLKKNKNIHQIFNYGLSDIQKKTDVFIPYLTFMGKKFSFPTYTANNFKEVEKFIKKDFFFNRKMLILKENFKLKKCPKNVNIKNIDLIKIDVNGFELNVLKTLKKVIIKNRPAIYLEITFKRKEICQFLIKLGYDIYFYSERQNILKKGFSKKIVNYFCLQKKHLN